MLGNLLYWYFDLFRGTGEDKPFKPQNGTMAICVFLLMCAVFGIFAKFVVDIVMFLPLSVLSFALVLVVFVSLTGYLGHIFMVREDARRGRKEQK